jgi:CheY-like chemotaxis protein
MDGHAFRSVQIANLASAKIPLVVLSGGEGTEHSPLAKSACAYLKKPFSLPELLSSVARCVELHERCTRALSC